jgi:hypothetical protein
MFENLTMQVAWRTPLAKLDALETAINTWLSTEQNRWFVPGTSVTLQHIEFQRYLEFTMAFGHNGYVIRFPCPPYTFDRRAIEHGKTGVSAPRARRHSTQRYNITAVS